MKDAILERTERVPDTRCLKLAVLQWMGVCDEQRRMRRVSGGRGRVGDEKEKTVQAAVAKNIYMRRALIA